MENGANACPRRFVLQHQEACLLLMAYDCICPQTPGTRVTCLYGGEIATRHNEKRKKSSFRLASGLTVLVHRRRPHQPAARAARAWRTAARCSRITAQSPPLAALAVVVDTGLASTTWWPLPLTSFGSPVWETALADMFGSPTEALLLGSEGGRSVAAV